MNNFENIIQVSTKESMIFINFREDYASSSYPFTNNA